MNSETSPQIPLEERAYLEFAKRRGFSHKTDDQRRYPTDLKWTPLYRGFTDAFLGNSPKIYDPKDRDALLDQSEYNLGFRGGMFAGLIKKD